MFEKMKLDVWYIELFWDTYMLFFCLKTILLWQILFIFLSRYVLFAIKRRKELKVTNPEVSFQDATKRMGQEWSDLSGEEKDVSALRV